MSPEKIGLIGGTLIVAGVIQFVTGLFAAGLSSETHDDTGVGFSMALLLSGIIVGTFGLFALVLGR